MEAATAPATVTVLSHRDPKTGAAFYDTCTVQVAGHPVAFKHGTAQNVPAHIAKAFRDANPTRVYVPEPLPADPAPAPAAETEHREPPGRRELTEAERQQRAREAAEYLEGEGAREQAELEREAEKVAKGQGPLHRPGEQASEQVGKTAPAPGHAKMIPQGFDARTADGELRCLAAKADGGQCTNIVKAGTSACGMAPHQEQVAGLPDAPAA